MDARGASTPLRYAQAERVRWRVGLRAQAAGDSARPCMKTRDVRTRRTLQHALPVACGFL